jgi:translation elongation factor EF-1alpha
LHIHTVAYDCIAKSFSKNIARIQTKIPICLEKKDASSNLGRFSLRDEGKIIALGRVIKCEPAKKFLRAHR